MTITFIDTFWETDFNGTLGFELLCKRIREGQKVCKDIEEFFKKKAKAEMQYCKALRILSRSADGKEETGDLGTSWIVLKAQTEKTATFHETSANELTKLADELSRFADGVKVESKQIEEKVKERQKTKRNAHSKLQELQKSYHEKCREMLQHDNQLETAKQAVTTSQKDLDKFRSKADKSKEAMEKSDMLYKQSVDVLEQARAAWETDMEEACQVYQRQEEERIYLLRDLLWRCTNVDSQLCVDWDESSESVRLYLEKCDVSKDLTEFIQNNMTGRARPAPIEYENYFDDKQKSPSPNPGRRRPQIGLPHVPSARSMTLGSEYATVYSV